MFSEKLIFPSTPARSCRMIAVGGCAAQFQVIVDKLRELGLPFGRE